MARKKRIPGLSFESELGDFVGQGKTFASDANYQVNLRSTGKSLETACFTIDNRTNNWAINFASPKGQRLKKGTYEDAVRFAFRKDEEAGFALYGNGRGANEVFAKFTVECIRRSKATGVIVLFRAKFTQRADRADAPALSGRMYYCAPKPKA